MPLPVDVGARVTVTLVPHASNRLGHGAWHIDAAALAAWRRALAGVDEPTLVAPAPGPSAPALPRFARTELSDELSAGGARTRHLDGRRPEGGRAVCHVTPLQRNLTEPFRPALLLLAVGLVGRDDEQHLAADLLAGDAVRPAGDHAVERERRRGATAPRGVERRAVEQAARVLDGDRLVLGDLRAVALFEGLCHPVGGLREAVRDGDGRPAAVGAPAGGSARQAARLHGAGDAPVGSPGGALGGGAAPPS